MRGGRKQDTGQGEQARGYFSCAGGRGWGGADSGEERRERLMDTWEVSSVGRGLGFKGGAKG